MNPANTSSWSAFKRRVFPRLSFSNVVALVALFLAAGGGAYAAAAGNPYVTGGGVVQGCVSHGVLHVVKAGRACPKHTVPLAFNQKGQPGQNGKNGTGGSADASGPAGGSLTGTYPNPSIASGSITAGDLGAGSVTSAALASQSVGGTTCGFLPVPHCSAGQIKQRSVTSDELAAGAVNVGALRGGAVNVSLNVPSVPAQSCSVINAAVAGVPANSYVVSLASPATNGLSADLVAAPVDVTTSGHIQLELCNPTGVSQGYVGDLPALVVGP